jgi:hypothetical protein
VNNVDKAYICRKFTALKFPRQDPLVLLVKADRRQGKSSGMEERKMMGTELRGICSREEGLGTWGLNFAFGEKSHGKDCDSSLGFVLGCVGDEIVKQRTVAVGCGRK